MQTPMSTIEEFLSQRHLALVGVSRNPKDLSRVILRELRKRGYQVALVNPAGGTIDGLPVHRSVAEIPQRPGEPPSDGAIIMVPASESAAVVAACVEAGVPRVWLHRGAGRGATSPEATHLAHSNGLWLVDGACPLMFIGGGLHALHGALRRVVGDYPDGGTRPAGRLVRISLVVLQLIVALGALVAGSAFMADPSGAMLGMTTRFLEHSPFASFLVPGIVLFVVNGVGQLACAILVMRKRQFAARFSIAFGIILCGWIVGQWLWLSGTSWLQPTIFAIGVAEVALGFGLVPRAHQRIDGPRISALLSRR